MQTHKFHLFCAADKSVSAISWVSDKVTDPHEFRKCLIRAARRLQNSNREIRSQHYSQGYGWNVGDLQSEGGPELLEELKKEDIEDFNVEYCEGVRGWDHDDVLLRRPDGDGDDEKLYLNQYVCPKCGDKWEEEWDSWCDSECGKCGCRNIMPVKSTLINGDDDEGEEEADTETDGQPPQKTDPE